MSYDSEIEELFEKLNYRQLRKELRQAIETCESGLDDDIEKARVLSIKVREAENQMPGFNRWSMYGNYFSDPFEMEKYAFEISKQKY